MTERPPVIMSAIPQELAALRAELAGRVDHPVGSRIATTGLLAGRPVVLGEAGIGKVNAAVVTTRLVDRFDPAVILFTGVAGGVDPDLGVGDVVIGERTIHHDAGVIEGEALQVYQAGHTPFFNPTDRLGFRPSDALLACALEAASGLALDPVIDPARAPRVVAGTILTGDQFVNCEATRDRLHRELGGHAVEMEGAAVAQAARALGADCLVVRSLSDLAGAGSDIDFVRFLDAVARNSARVVAAIVRNLP
ncbi:MAG TPA: 5'-methylthioadenosine/adenosylhomocysteine nucleosidase [Acidimicrobiia bacterium]